MFDPIPDGPGGLPFPTTGGTGRGGFGGFLGDLSDLIGDAGDLVEIIQRGGSGSGGGGFNLPVPIGTSKLRDDVVGAVEMKPALKAAFLNFLRSIQVADSWLQNLAGLPTLSWPAFVSDLLLIWLDNERPFSGESPGGLEVAEAVPGDLFGPSTLPVPGGGSGGSGLIGIPELERIAPISMPAYPTMVYRAPKGYSTVTWQGEKLFVRTDVAKTLKLVKSRKKPPISAKDWDAVKSAKRIDTKLAKMLNSTSCSHKAVKRTGARRR